MIDHVQRPPICFALPFFKSYGRRDVGARQVLRLDLFHSIALHRARFYDAPLLPSPGSAMGEPACAYEDGQLVLHFTAYNSFKQNSKAPGTYSLTQTAPGLDQVVAEGAFAFEPFWRPTKVMGVPVKLADPSSREVRLEVMNERGRSTAYVFNCTR